MGQKTRWLDRSIHPALPAITYEILIFVAIIILAVISRFYDLGARVMSHDESLHTYFSWLLYRGQGYQHTPMMHGPWQFHLIAFSYFLFGASDFTARIPAALFGIASIAMVWYWRQYLGRMGSLIAGILMVISPYLLFYARYVREDMYAVFAGILLLYSVLRYLETGRSKYLFILVAALVLHYLDKETSYIHTLQLLGYAGVYFIVRVTRASWTDHGTEYIAFIVTLAIVFALLLGAGVAAINAREAAAASAAETAAPLNPDQSELSPLAPEEAQRIPAAWIFVGLALVAFCVAVFLLIRGYGWQRVLEEKSFDLLLVTLTLILPLGTPFVILPFKELFKVTIPTDAASVQNLTVNEVAIIAAFLAAVFAVAIAVGWLWNRKLWWKLALTFWVPYTVLYTTFFTNNDGFFTGTLGSLGYWMVQQDVQRGSQPWYYYLLVQIPMYEFLPALGFILALFLALRRKPSVEAVRESEESTDPAADIRGNRIADPNFVNTFSLLVYWSIISMVTLSYAGERMPWLTVHLTWPMILLTGWALGQVLENLDWESLRSRRVLLTLITVVIFVASLMNALLNWASNPPFQGKELTQLQATSAFLLPAIVTVASAAALVYLLRNWTFSQVGRIFLLTFFGFLMVITGRAAFRAAYINYDNATEFLVYAHGATGIKQVMAQAREISERTVGGLNVSIAYDASAPDTGVSWPFVWYLREYTNQRSFDAPTRALRDSVLVVVDAKNFDKIEPALGPDYHRIDYIRMWWPMQDYFGLVSPRNPDLPIPPDYPCRGVLSIFRLFRSSDYSRICTAITDPDIRAGLVDIWWNRDYTRYAEATNHSDLTLSTWQPSDAMRLYIRKDVVAQIWNYGVSPVASEASQDPTEGKAIELAADLVIDGSQLEPSGLNNPRSLAFAPDGSFYVADSHNHRILHLDQNGNLINSWGSFSQGTDTSPAPLGTFNEPWGVAVDSEGSIYVTDTWNHRVQKFHKDGIPLTQWGYFGQAETLDALYGPRGIAVDSEGRVFVADTGNKRIVVFDSRGTPITAIGSAGFDPGQFDEPVGVAVDSAGRVYVADTWNQRIQIFSPAPDGLSFTPDRQWNVYGWFGQSLENKPFIAVDGDGRVFITDPEGYRVMEFLVTGELKQIWGDYGETASTFALPSGIAVDSTGRVWVTDATSNRILRFIAP